MRQGCWTTVPARVQARVQGPALRTAREQVPAKVPAPGQVLVKVPVKAHCSSAEGCSPGLNHRHPNRRR
jgi:hypothetical protein